MEIGLSPPTNTLLLKVVVKVNFRDLQKQPFSATLIAS